jgi:hypothetical protein
MSKKIDAKKKIKIDETLANVRGIIRHIRNVQDNCILLGEKLIELGNIELGKNLISNGLKHDSSKFHGVEYEFMAPMYAKQPDDKEETKTSRLKMAISHHNTTNYHHPEAWQSIHFMPELFVAEMVCDWKARSEEFGSSLRDYIQNQAMKRFGFDDKAEVYKKIMYFVDMICEKPFTSTT